MKIEKFQKTPAIRINSIGYLPVSAKIATVDCEGHEFFVRKSPDNSIALRGTLTTPCFNKDTGETLRHADFSDLQAEGEYYLEIPGAGQSAIFQISRVLFESPFYTVMRGMYLWRCGTAVHGNHEGQEFFSGACHLEDGWLDRVEGRHTRKNSCGGWHDAGDYNKYVTNAGVTLGLMFKAWELFHPAIEKINLDLPDSSKKRPDYLTEIRWELDWLFTMQREDGAVYHKLSTQSFGPFIPAEEEFTPRFFTDWSTQATAQFVAMMAMASRVYRPYEPDFADKCLDLALKSWSFLTDYPETKQPDLSQFSTGTYLSGDSDSRLWAAVELWETTGNSDYRNYFEENALSFRCLITADWDWHSLQNLAFCTYLLSRKAKSGGWFSKRLQDQWINMADDLVAIAGFHGYGRPMGTRYYWGCNGTVARQVLILITADRLDPDPLYRRTATAALDHLFGRNVHGRSYVTGLGDQPPQFPHDRRCGTDPIGPAWPGYLVGGPHPKAVDWHDVQESAATNEIAINWNAALIFALAAFLPD